jgi:hypothetical protein
MAGLAGGLAMYVWMSVAHMALPLARVGISQVGGKESALLSAMQSSLGNSSGMYIFPGFDFSGNQAAAMKAYDAKLVNNPSGILIYHPPGAQGMTARQLIGEFLLELFEAMLAVWLLAQTTISGFWSRVGFMAAAGLLASLPTNTSNLIWYGFPATYTAATMFTEIVAFTVAGCAASLVLKRPRVTASAPDKAYSSAHAK